MAPFYNGASVVLNLSDRRRFIETFGLTALEAMSCALPVVTPTAGGIAEMVSEGENGYKIDSWLAEELEQRIRCMLTDKELYQRLAEGARRQAAIYDPGRMTTGIAAALDG